MEFVLWGTLCVALAPMLGAGALLGARAATASIGHEHSVVDAGLSVNDAVLNETRQAGSASGIWSVRGASANAEDEITWALRQLRPDVGPEPSHYAPFVARGSALANASACEAEEACVDVIAALQPGEPRRREAGVYAPELISRTVVRNASWSSEFARARADDAPVEELTSQVGASSFAVGARLAAGEIAHTQSLTFSGVGAFEIGRAHV